MNKLLHVITTFFFVSLTSILQAQTSLVFALKTSPTASLVFNTIDKYQNGLVIPFALTLRVDAVGTEWDLYVGTTTTTPGFFDVNNSYGSSGNSNIPVDLLKARVYNTSNTSLTSNTFFNLSDIAAPVELIGDPAVNDPSVACGSTGTNVAGSYTSQPQCYTFKVDLKITPGLTYRAGLYSLTVNFFLVQDL